MSLLLAACQPPPSAPPSPTAGSPPTATAPSASGVPAAKRAPGQEHAEPLRIFRAFGTEPFWNVNVEGSRLTYTTPEDQAGMVMEGARRALADGVEIAGEHDGKAFVLTVTTGTCSDGMSDIEHRMVSTFRYGEIDYTGCGEAAK
ncbi:MAG TPA: hypothetical protein VLC71_08500 [Thermomonas sp.]|nr:hypothetical protein [Thermomonas sp.]